MKKIFKKEIIIPTTIAFLVGIILASSIAVYAISANNVDYNRSGTSTTVKVNAALDDLYSKLNSATNVSLEKVVLRTYTYDPEDSVTNYNSQECANGTWGYGVLKVSAQELPNYQELTIDNFVIEATGLQAGMTGGTYNLNNGGMTISISSYENGILTINLPRTIRNNKSFPILHFSVVAYYISHE